jgi:hypothetical protein
MGACQALSEQDEKNDCGNTIEQNQKRHAAAGVFISLPLHENRVDASDPFSVRHFHRRASLAGWIVDNAL